MRMCKKCFDEVEQERSQRCDETAMGALPSIRPRLFTDTNHMDTRDTFPELDALSFFEEEILSPVQPMIARVHAVWDGLD